MTVCRKTLQDVQLRFRGRAKSLLALSQTRTTRSSGKTGPFSCNSVLCHPMLAEPPDHEEDCSKNDRKKYEQAYYISHPARRQGIIDVSVICFLFVSFHVVTPFVRVPPCRELDCYVQSISASTEAVCRKTQKKVNHDCGTIPCSKNSVKNYIS